MNGPLEVAAAIVFTGAWATIYVSARALHRVARRCSVFVHRYIGPCDSCGWPIARGHRPTCSGR